MPTAKEKLNRLRDWFAAGFVESEISGESDPGYRWTWVAENLAWGSGSLGRPYAIFSEWMRSPGHRANILSPGFRDLGIAVRRGSFSGSSTAYVWVVEFGSH